MTQALDILLLNTPNSPIVKQPEILPRSSKSAIKLTCLPYKFYFKPADIISFDLRSTPRQLFEKDEQEEEEEKKVNFSTTSVVEENSMIYLDDESGLYQVTGVLNNSGKKRKLRFDESSIQETSMYNGRVSKKSNFANVSDVVIGDEELAEYMKMAID